MSEYRLRQGHHEARNLWQHHVNEAPASKSGECVGRVDSAELAAEIVAAVNAARDAAARGLHDTIQQASEADWLTEEQTAAVMQVVAPHLADAAELERLRELERNLSEAVWVHPGVQGGRPCIGGTRVTVDTVASLMVDVPAEEINEDYPSVTADGARAAAAFADRYTDRRAQDDPGETDQLDTELAEERTAHQDTLARIEGLHREIADAVNARDKDNAYNEYTREQLKQVRAMQAKLLRERDEARAALEKANRKLADADPSGAERLRDALNHATRFEFPSADGEPVIIERKDWSIKILGIGPHWRISKGRSTRESKRDVDAALARARQLAGEVT